MKKIIFPAFLLLVLTLGFNSAFAAVPTAPGQNKLTCFDGVSEGTIYGGSCVMKSNGARGPATLDNIDGDIHGSYSGVYVETSTLYGELLGEVSQLSFNYTGVATAGSPRISLPVDTTGDGLTDGYLFISSYYCNDGEGTVDVINDATCTIYTNFSADSWANWDELVAAHPDWKIGTDAYVFIIADDVGMWTVSGVKLGSVK
jgi:hypothetical protein